MSHFLLMIGAVLIIWYIVSETLSWMICKIANISPDKYDSEHVLSIRAGVFLSPVLIPLMVALWLAKKFIQHLRRVFGGGNVD